MARKSTKAQGEAPKTRTKTKEKIDIKLTVVPEAPKAEFKTDAFVRELREMDSKIAAGDKWILKGAVIAADHHVSKGHLFARIKKEWEKVGKPVPLSQVKADLGVNDADWSRYMRLSKWADDNGATLDKMPPEQKARAIMEQLAILRSQSSKAKAEASDKGQSKSTSSQKADIDNDKVNLGSTLREWTEESAALLIKAIFDEKLNRADARKLIEKEIAEIAVAYRKL